MNRRNLIAVCAAGALGAALGARAQPRTWRIGILSARPIASLEADAQFGAFLNGMRELGYAQGRNLQIEYRSADGDYDQLPRLAAALVALKVDVILVAGAPTARAAQQATRTIPIVMATVGDPVGSGFVANLARPGGNITGLSDVAGDLGSKLLDVLLGAAPKLRHVGVLLNPGNPSHAAIFASVQDGARHAQVKVLRVEARSPEGIEGGFALMAKERVGGVVAFADPLFNARQVQIAELAMKHRLPCISGFRQYVHAGGLMNYGPDFSHNFRRAATYVERILKGAKPSDLPVEQSTRFELAVNLRTAKALGLVFPGPLLARADEIVR